MPEPGDDRDEGCFVKGCDGLALWGFGSVRAGTHRKGCKGHRELLWAAELPVASGRAAIAHQARPASVSQRRPSGQQGSLF